MIRSLEIATKFRITRRPLFRIGERVGIPIEIGRHAFAKALEIEAFEVAHQPVRGQNRQPLRVRVDERHHGELVRRVFVPRKGTRRIGLGFLAFRGRLLAVFISEIQRRLVAMVPIGDHEFLRRHRRFDSPDRFRIGRRPEPVQHVKFIAHLDRSVSSRDIFEQRVNLSRLVVVQHEKLSRLRPCVPQ